MTMMSPHAAGWTGDGPHALGKRKARHVDGASVQPTPPRTRMAGLLPTPETGRRISKRSVKPQPESQPTVASIPTPQTLPRKRKTPPSPAEEEAAQQPDPSPSGHTTFFMSYSDASTSRSDSTYRRRPGLTFAQQMAAASSQPPAGRYGVGVGMRGTRTGGHQVDKIVPKPVATLDDNPFIIPGSAAANAASPGLKTTHRPALVSPDRNMDSSPRTRSRAAQLRSPPMINSDPVHSTTSLLSPPGTSRANRIRTTPSPPSPATIARREKAERLRKMRDEDENPFLIKPGQKVVHRPRPVVDETEDTVTYVFRGAKKIFANPFIPHHIPVEGSNLDVEDEDFEPHPCPPPRLLWPTEPEATVMETPGRKGGVSARTTGRHRVMSEDEHSPPSSPIHMVTPGGPQSSARFVSDDEFLPEGEEEDIPVRRGLLFGPQATIKPRESRTVRRSNRMQSR